MAQTLNEQFQSKYYSASENCVSLGTLVPKSMAFEQKRFNQRMKAELGDIDEYVAEKLHYPSVKELCGEGENTRFSREQIDAIATAIYTHEKTGNAIIVADQTGVGKGRVAAGLIRYAILDKKVVPFFITEKKHLIHDIYRDLIDIGFDTGVPELIVTKKEIEKKEYTDDEIESLIRFDIEENDELRFEYDLDEDFELSELFNEENIELLGEIIEFYKDSLQIDAYTDVYEYNKDRNKEIDNAIKKGLYEIKPFTTFPFDVKDKKGNILYSNNQKDISSILKKGNLPKEYKLITFPYSQIQRPYDRSGNLTDKSKFLQKMAAKTVVVMDESHSAAGFKSGGELTNIARMIQAILGSASMVTFMSATFAKRPDNMFLYANNNSIGETGLSGLALKYAFEKGDIALQEAVSSELVRIGQLIRRQKEIMGETTYLEESDNTEVGISQVNKLNKVAALFSKVSNFSQFVRQALEQVKKDEGLTDYKFAGKIGRFQFQLFQFFILGLKVQQTAKEAITQLGSGRKVVISVANTLESAFKNVKKDFISDTNFSIGDEINNDFNLFLAYLLDYTLRIAEEKEAFVDGQVTKKREIIKIKKSKDRVAKLVYELVEDEYKNVLKEILDSEIGVPISPIDQIKTLIKSQNFEVDEITGRLLALDFDKNDYSKGKLVKRKPRKKEEIIRDFNTNKIDCVILNQAGAVGVSMHAIKYDDVDIVLPEPPTSLKNKKEVKQRCMIITQMELDVNKEVQKLGRIDRTGQVYPPIYRYIISCIPSESRLTALNEKKLRSLSANVSSDQKAASHLFEAEDFYSTTAIEPFNETMVDMTQADRAQNKKDIEKYTKKLYFYPYNFQNKFYTIFTDKLNKHIKFLKDNNLYQGAVSLKDYKAKDQQIYPFIIGNNDSLSSFGRHSVLEISKCTEYELKNLEYDVKVSIEDKLVSAKEEANKKIFNKVSDFAKYYDSYFKNRLSEIKQDVDKDILDKNTIIKGLESEIKELKSKQKLVPKLGEAIKLRDDIKNINTEIAEKSASVAELLTKGEIEKMNEVLSDVQNKQKQLSELKDKLEGNEEYKELLEKENEYLKIDVNIELKEKEVEKIKNQIQKRSDDYLEYEGNVSIAKNFYNKIGNIFNISILIEDTEFKYNENNEYVGDEYKYTYAYENKPYVLTGFSFDGGFLGNPTLGNMSIYLMGVTDKETFTLSKAYRLFSEKEKESKRKHTLTIQPTDENYLDDKSGIGAWNKIASLVDTGYEVEKYILTGSLLKCFSTLQGVGIDGSITKYTTADGKQRLGIELSTKSKDSFVDRMSRVQYPVYLDLITSNFRKLILDNFYFIANDFEQVYHELCLVGFKDKAFLNLFSTASYYEKQNMSDSEFFNSVKVRILSEKLPFCEYMLQFINSSGIENYLLLSRSGSKQSKVNTNRYYGYDYSEGNLEWDISSSLGQILRNVFPSTETTYNSLRYDNEIKTFFGIEMSLSDFFELIDNLQKQKLILTTATSNVIIENKKDFYIFEQNVDEINDFAVGSNDQYFVKDALSEEVELALDDIINNLLEILR